MRVSKNGQDFFDIDDSQDSVEAARKKGYKTFLTVTKNGKELFDIEDSPESWKAAEAKGYTTIDGFATRKAEEKYDRAPSKFDSAILGGTKGASFGFGDEIAGGLEALGSKFGVRGLSGSFSDAHLETPEEDKQSFGDVYRQGRDSKRKQYGEAEAGNKKTFIAAELVGGVSSGIAAPGANTIRGAAGLGGLAGLGGSEADLSKGNLSDFKEAAKDTAIGATVGAGTQGVLNLGSGAFQAAKEYVPTAIKAFKGGQNMASGALEAAGAVVAQAKNSREFGRMVKSTRSNIVSSMVEDGHPGSEIQAAESMMSEMSDHEFVLKALADGNEEVWDWVTRKASSLSPSNMNADEYKEIALKGIDRRNAARNFDRKEAAAELKQVVSDASSAFDQANAETVGRHTQRARDSFDGKMGDLWDATKAAMEDADSNPELISSKIADRIQAASKMLNQGHGLNRQGMNPGPYSSAANSERFNRLTEMRKTLDKGIDWDAIRSGKRDMNEGESILADLRTKVDELLKSVPGKSEADAASQRAFDLDDKIFSKTEFKRGVDEGKLTALLYDGQNPTRFRAALEELEGWAADESLDSSARARVKTMIGKFRDVLQKSDDQRQLGGFKYMNGPTSAAIEGLKSSMGKQNLLQDAVLSPTGFLNNLDNFAREIESMTGKNWGKLSEAEKSAAVRLWTWGKGEANKGYIPTPDAFKNNYQLFLRKVQEK